jgi:CSLREA domain-containing protein
MASILRTISTLALGLTIPAAGFAFDFVVTRYDDPVPDGCLAGDCSLREAVIAANADAAFDRIRLSAGAYVLSQPGAGENNSLTGDLDVTKDLEILGVAPGITRIVATGLGEAGAQALSADLTLRRLRIEDADAAGVALGPGTHLIEDCDFLGNGTTGSNAGILATIQSVVTIRRTTVRGGPGRGMTFTQGTAVLENVTVSGTANVPIAVNDTLSFQCTHCTLVRAPGAGPALQVSDVIATVANSILSGGCSLITGGTVDSQGGNIETPVSTCGLDQASDQPNVSVAALDLGPLQDNGGLTLTHLPGVDGAADGSALDALCGDEDQRGVVRETNCETGAVERSSAVPASPIFLDGFEQGDPEAWSLRFP